MEQPTAGSSTTALQRPIVLATGLLLLLLIPFFLLSFYNHPAADDADFFVNNRDQGFLAAQLSTYLDYNGRYFATFVISLPTVLFPYGAAHKLLPLLLFGGTFFAFRQFFLRVLTLSGSGLAMLMALAATFVFVTLMPTLPEGYYWQAGAWTYQLANILFLLFLVRLYMLIMAGGSRKSVLITALLIILINGCNEISAIAANLVLLSVLFFVVLRGKKYSAILLVALASATSLPFLLFSPGTGRRQALIADIVKHNVAYTLTNGLSAFSHYAGAWIASPVFLLCTALFILLALISPRPLHQIRLSTAFYFLGCSFLLLLALFSAGYWTLNDLIPDRAVNVIYWLFLIAWFSIVYILCCVLRARIPERRSGALTYLVLIPVCLIGPLSRSAENFSLACNDLLSGEAYRFDKDLTERANLLTAADKDKIAYIPQLSAYPACLFIQDLSHNDSTWENYMNATVYHLKGIRTFEVPSAKAVSFFFDMESDSSRLHSSVVSTLCFSPTNSSLMDGPKTFSFTFTRSFGELNVGDPAALTTVEVSGEVYSADTTAHCVVVFSVMDSSNTKTLLWTGSDLPARSRWIDTWHHERISFALNRNDLLRPENKVVIYLLNLGNNKVYLDNLRITFH